MFKQQKPCNLNKNSKKQKMSDGSGSSQSPPAMASISDVSALFQTAKKYEELNVIGTGKV